jgi:hypothetical protein
MADAQETWTAKRGGSAEVELIELREGDRITDPDVLARVAALLLAPVPSDSQKGGEHPGRTRKRGQRRTIRE